jgi:hypothetical protein
MSGHRKWSEPIAWRVTVETFPGFTDSDAVLTAVAEALEADDRIGSAACGLNNEAGAISATTSIEDPRQMASIEIATRAFYDALGSAGYEVDRPGWRLLIEAQPLFAEDD